MASGHLCTKIHFNQNATDKGVKEMAVRHLLLLPLALCCGLASAGENIDEIKHTFLKKERYSHFSPNDLLVVPKPDALKAVPTVEWMSFTGLVLIVVVERCKEYHPVYKLEISNDRSYHLGLLHEECA